MIQIFLMGFLVGLLIVSDYDADEIQVGIDGFIQNNEVLLEYVGLTFVVILLVFFIVPSFVRFIHKRREYFKDET